MELVSIYLRGFGRPLVFLSTILLSGSFGYHLIEQMSVLDSLYMTVITVSTVGFHEVKALSDSGKIFTMFLVTAGIMFYGVTVNGIFRVFLERSFTSVMTEIRMRNRIAKMKNHYIICGGGNTAATIAEELERAGKQFVMIEKDHGAAGERRSHWPVLEKDALDEAVLEEARIADAVGLAAVLSSDADNLFVVLSARRMNPKLTIQTRIESEKTRSKMLQAGANHVVSPKRVGGLQMARSFLNPEVHNLMSVVLDRASSLEFEMKIHAVGPDDSYAGRAIREADFRDLGYIIIAVRYPDGKMVFAPQADFRLDPGVDLFLIGPGRSAPGG